MTLLTLVSLFPASLAAQPFSAKPGNTIPSGHHAAGLRSAQLVRTLDANGNLNWAGKIVLLSIGAAALTHRAPGPPKSQQCL